MTHESKDAALASLRAATPGGRSPARAAAPPRPHGVGGFGNTRVLQNRRAPAQLSLFRPAG